MFRGKESSNRIELSRLVQDLLNFGVLGSLWLWGGAGGCEGVWGHGECPHTCAHAHTCMHMHTHTCKEIANGHQHVYHDSGVFPVFPIIPMLSPLSPCCPCHPHIIAVIPTSSPDPHLTTHPPPPPPPLGGPPKSVKIQ